MTKLSVLIGVQMLAAMTSTGMSKELGEIRQEPASMIKRGRRFALKCKRELRKSLKALYGAIPYATLFTLVAALLVLLFYQLFGAPLILVSFLLAPSTIVALIKILLDMKSRLDQKTTEEDRRFIEQIIGQTIEDQKREINGHKQEIKKKSRKIAGLTRKITSLKDMIEQLASSIRTAGITTYEIVRSYDKPVKAILLMKFRETRRGKRQVVLKNRLKELGFKFIWGGVRILPPKKTPQDLDSQEDLDRWIRDNITDGLGPEFKYVFPFATLLDLRMVFSERKGKPEFGPAGRVRTLFEELGADDFDPGVVYGCIKKRHLSFENLISRGDIVFLAKLSDPSSRDNLEQSKEGIMKELMKKAGVKRLDLSYFSSMDKKGERRLSAALKGHVSNEKAVARGIIEEAKLWNSILSDRTRHQLLKSEN